MVQFEKKLITPELAKEMLASNEGNRKLKLSAVEKYAKEIKSGFWKEDTGEVIKISKSGKVLDGQHRLHAIIKADTALNLHICSGLEDEIFKVIDTGVSRNSNDVFAISGILNATVLPSLITAWYNLKTKRLKLKSTVLSNQAILDIYEDNTTEWQELAKKSDNFYLSFSRILNKTVIASLYKMFKDKAGQDLADDFFTQLCKGKEFSNETIFLLRKKLTEDKISMTKLPIAAKYGLIIKTWNAYRQGKNLKRLFVSPEIEDII